MDRTLLERMVGAVVLVLLFVLFAPVLLDGSVDGDADKRAEPSAQGAKRTEVIILNAPVNAQPRAAEPAGESAAKRNVKRAARPAKATPRTSSTAAPPPTGFAVQLGSFSERENAARYAERVKTEGFAAFIVRAAASSGAVYRVYSGPVDSRDAAGELAEKLQAVGHNVMVAELGN